MRCLHFHERSRILELCQDCLMTQLQRLGQQNQEIAVTWGHFSVTSQDILSKQNCLTFEAVLSRHTIILYDLQEKIGFEIANEPPLVLKLRYQVE